MRRLRSTGLLRAMVREPDLVARGGTRVMRLAERRPNALTRLASLGATPADRRLLAASEGGTPGRGSTNW